jgi:hypothetical protein
LATGPTGLPGVAPFEALVLFLFIVAVVVVIVLVL